MEFVLVRSSGLLVRAPEAHSVRGKGRSPPVLLNSGGAESITDAQFKIARLYGFVGWLTLKAHVDLIAGAQVRGHGA
jgi:hypothetical protein